MATRKRQAVVFFDGCCRLCNGAVEFIRHRDAEHRFRFIPIRTKQAAKLLEEFGVQPPKEEPTSVMLLEGDKLYQGSTASLRIAKHLSGGWKAAYGLMLVPRPIRDGLYYWVGQHRYHWFGKTGGCPVDTCDKDFPPPIL